MVLHLSNAIYFIIQFFKASVNYCVFHQFYVQADDQTSLLRAQVGGTKLNKDIICIYYITVCELFDEYNNTSRIYYEYYASNTGYRKW